MTPRIASEPPSSFTRSRPTAATGARTLGLQRTYLLKLIRTFRIDVPARGKNPNGTRDC